MPNYIWINDGAIVVEDGAVVICDQCPCGVPICDTDLPKSVNESGPETYVPNDQTWEIAPAFAEWSTATLEFTVDSWDSVHSLTDFDLYLQIGTYPATVTSIQIATKQLLHLSDAATTSADGRTLFSSSLTVLDSNGDSVDDIQEGDVVKLQLERIDNTDPTSEEWEARYYVNGGLQSTLSTTSASTFNESTACLVNVKFGTRTAVYTDITVSNITLGTE